MEMKKIALVASRLKCVDAISIEADKWAEKYTQMGHGVHLIAGKFGEPVSLPHFIVPEMDYKHPEIRGVKRIMFGAQLDKDGQKAAGILLNSLVKRIKGPLKNYLVKNRIDILSVEDALVSLKNPALVMALSEIVKELGISTISRVHYLPWNNSYFTRFNNMPKLMESLPPAAKNVVHITNTAGSMQSLKQKRDMQSMVIPNSINFSRLQQVDDYNRDFRKAFNIRDDQLIFLQPTRVKRNKAIEQSIRLVSEINSSLKKDHVLMVTGSPVYSRQNYFEEVVKKAARHNVNVIFANDRIFLGRHQNSEQKFYSIHDAYAHADIVLYPNTSDAFGNPVIEAAAYKKPVVVNKYPNLEEFTGKGFQFVVMDQKVTNETVSDTCEIIMDAEKRQRMVESNFQLARAHYSSTILGKSLYDILTGFDHHRSFISRFSVIIPARFLRSPDPKSSQQKKQDRPHAQAPGHGDRRNIKKGKPAVHDRHAPVKEERRDEEAALKNRKGGYREPKNAQPKKEA